MGVRVCVHNVLLLPCVCVGGCGCMYVCVCVRLCVVVFIYIHIKYILHLYDTVVFLSNYFIQISTRMPRWSASEPGATSVMHSG